MNSKRLSTKALIAIEQRRIYGGVEPAERHLPPLHEQEVLEWLRAIASGSAERGIAAALAPYDDGDAGGVDRARFIQPATPNVSDLARLLPLLTHAQDLRPAEWLRTSLTTFAKSVASFVPGSFEAYARVFHPLLDTRDGLRGVRTWREVAADAHLDVDHRLSYEKLERFVPTGARAMRGTLPAGLIGPLVEHMEAATTTPDDCWFAEWDGFGDSVPHDLEPKLDLPGRRYHVFAGPIEGAHSNFAPVWFSQQTANLWWPADHAWCVATEIDFHWTYIGGARSCIASLLADPRLETIEITTAPFLQKIEASS